MLMFGSLRTICEHYKHTHKLVKESHSEWQYSLKKRTVITSKSLSREIRNRTAVKCLRVFIWCSVLISKLFAWFAVGIGTFSGLSVCLINKRVRIWLDLSNNWYGDIASPIYFFKMRLSLHFCLSLESFCSFISH